MKTAKAAAHLKLELMPAQLSLTIFKFALNTHKVWSKSSLKLGLRERALGKS